LGRVCFIPSRCDAASETAKLWAYLAAWGSRIGATDELRVVWVSRIDFFASTEIGFGGLHPPALLQKSVSKQKAVKRNRKVNTARFQNETRRIETEGVAVCFRPQS
jgi:hypothetical protein